MLGRLRGLIRRRGPVGALALAATLGAVTGLLALNAVLAGWTYRDAARRDLRTPGRWALAVLLTGPLAFVPYAALQWYRDRSTRADRPSVGEPDDDNRTKPKSGDESRVQPEPTDGSEVAADDSEVAADGPEVATDGPDARDRPVGPSGGTVGPAVDPESRGRSLSLAVTAARYGGKAVVLGARGARWAGRRAVDRMNNG